MTFHLARKNASIVGIALALGFTACKPRNFNDGSAEVLTNSKGKTGGKVHVMIVDGETDDLGAIASSIAEVEQHGDRVGLIISAGPDVYVTDAMVKQFLAKQGRPDIKTAVGTGLSREAYAKMGSTGTALAYQDKGKGVIPEAELAQLVGKTSDGRAGQEALRKILLESGQKQVVLQIAAEATDAAAVLYENPKDSEATKNQKRELQKRIDTNLMMGGVLPEAPNKTGEIVFTEGFVQEASYNWDMNPVAANQMLSIKGIETLVWSSHAIQPAFAGGLNAGNASDFIDALYGDREGHSEFIEVMKKVNEHWDANAMKNLQALYDRQKAAWDADPERATKPEPQKHPALQSLEKYAGRQLTPADLLLVSQYYNKNIAKKTRFVNISVSSEIGPKKSGYITTVSLTDRSNVRIVTEVNTYEFKNAAAKSMRYAKKNFKPKAGSLEELSNERTSQKLIVIGKTQKDLLKFLSNSSAGGQGANDIGRFMDNYRLNEKQIERVVERIEANAEFKDAYSRQSAKMLDVLKDVIRVEAPKAQKAIP